MIMRIAVFAIVVLAGVISFQNCSQTLQPAAVSPNDEIRDPASGSLSDGNLTVTTKETFAHVVPYGLAKEYEGAYADSKRAALQDLAEVNGAALIYSHLGLLEKWHRESRAKGGGLRSEKEFNRSLIADANTAGAKVWLQVTPYHNWTCLSKGVYKDLTASEILEEKPEYSQKQYQKMFLKNVRQSIAPYLDAFGDSDNCRISFLEESTP
ncbi:MAG: hypothetical protein HRT45_19045 [Bdellovibrionales bacterium]|nr:hypothetical protein [Bdellovibrionales bacterium]